MEQNENENAAKPILTLSTATLRTLIEEAETVERREDMALEKLDPDARHWNLAVTPVGDRLYTVYIGAHSIDNCTWGMALTVGPDGLRKLYEDSLNNPQYIPKSE